MAPALTVLLVAVVMAAVFQFTFVVGARLRNFGIVDAVWSLAFAPVSWLIAASASGWGPRRLLLAVLATAWSLRLGLHLARRVASHHPLEDTRYAALRERWADRLAWKMSLFYQGQAVSVWLLAAPYFFIGYNTAEGFSALEIGGVALWILAWVGQATADRQLSRFQRDPANAGQVCAAGLWRYSRHPNYFFEWLGWLGLSLVAAATPWGWLGVISPLLMLHLLLNVTGVPLTEERSLAKRGDAYRRYQAVTPAFFPWFPRRPPSS